MIGKLRQSRFLFEELAKRDIKGKYKGTVLGMLWSILSPLFTLLIMRLVFNHFFGANIEHFTIYLFTGNIIFSYFCDATSQGMTSIIDNAGILTRVNAPKILFLLSKNVQSLINFLITTCILFIICLLDGVAVTWRFFLLVYPVAMLWLLLVGIGMILSTLYVFFRDTQYIWGICTTMLMYVSAIFYSIDTFPLSIQHLFFLNPIYPFIRYFRLILLGSTVPSAGLHLLIALSPAAMLGVGTLLYKKYSSRFVFRM